MTITENQAIAMARECKAGVFQDENDYGVLVDVYEFGVPELTAFANLAAASVEAENVKLRRLIERMISATDTPDARYWTNEYDRHRPTSTEHLDAIVAERVMEAQHELHLCQQEAYAYRDKLAAAESKLAECQRDADRYRKLKTVTCTDDMLPALMMFDGKFVGEFPTPEEFDAAIDAAIASENEGRKG